MDALAGLDEHQREVAESLLGPWRVLAGAGTGKTRALTHRIAHGIETGVYDPGSIMVLTFTSKAAAELRMRLRAMGLPPVQAKTFHAAALGQLRYFWPQVVSKRKPRVLSSKGTLIADAAKQLHLKLSTDDLRQLASEIEWRKVRELTVEQYSVVQRPTLEQLTAEQTVNVMMRYEHLKDKQFSLDFEDVLLTMLGMIRLEPGVAEEIHQRYKVYLVDEFQDVSPLQMELLKAWMGRRRDLLVVGDASQTIYSFAGARPDYLLNFTDYFPGAQTLQLIHNYRSTKQITDLANAVIEGQPGAVTLETDAPGAEVNAVECPDEATEASVVASKIAGLLANGAKPEHIAILSRINAQLPRFEQALRDASVPVALRGATPFFAREEIVKALTMFNAARTDSRPMLEVVSEVLHLCGWTQRKPVTPNTGAPEANVAGNAGLGDRTDLNRQLERWEGLNALYELAAEHKDQSIVEFAALMQERRQGQYAPESKAVTLSTIHAAKGLEWEHVFVVGASDGLLPYGDDKFVDEERRLLYVALTRAKQELTLTWASQGPTATRRLSRFLTRIPTTLLHRDRAQMQYERR